MYFYLIISSCFHIYPVCLHNTYPTPPSERCYADPRAETTTLEPRRLPPARQPATVLPAHAANPCLVSLPTLSRRGT